MMECPFTDTDVFGSMLISFPNVRLDVGATRWRLFRVLCVDTEPFLDDSHRIFYLQGSV